ncbi:natural resistance-associated macrophage protein [Helicosporidium sp. ATCC 50920]|nr:natural resistance-associated macrophage protein [Helicosporidium sp. ATCC 50920]|eukprot:KDD76937.1 natural resistance-associated macrophage protein [Helicosporidium sp. ATCC 50920]
MIEVIGGAVAFSNLSGGAIPLWAGVLLTGCGAFICLALESLGMRWLEWCLMLLIGVMTGTFCYLFSVAGVQAGPLFKGLAVPLIPEGTIQFAVGAIGAIIMPHNLYLHSSLVHTRCERASHLSPRRALNFVGAETAIALFISLVINVIIIAVFAATFFGTVEAGAVGLGNAGDYLQAVYGKHVKIIWAIGLLAAGNAATVTSTYAGQTVLDGYLGVKVSRWWRTAGVRLITLGPTLAIAFALQENSLDTLSNWLNIIQSLVLPFVVIPLLYLTSCKHIMGGEANKWWYTVIMGGFTVFLIGMNAYMFISMSFTAIPMVAWAQFLYWLAMFIYAAFVVYLAIGVSRCDRWAATLTRKMTNGRWPKQGPAAQCCGSPECAGIPPPAVEEKDVAGVQKVQ